MAEENPQQREVERNALIPNFLEIDDEPLDKMATRHQKKELRQLECDSKDDDCTNRLIKGLRPGDLMKVFEKLSWVNKVKTQPVCADLERWMTRMSEADRCHTLISDSVRQRVITLFIPFNYRSESAALDAIRLLVNVGSTRTLAIADKYSRRIGRLLLDAEVSV